MRRNTYLFAFISLAVAISLGALGAHKLKEELSYENLEAFKTGVFYQIVHAVALIGLAGLFRQINSKRAVLAINLLKIGPLLFSGSIYLLSTSKLTGLSIDKVLGPITPIGGVIMISGWILMAVVIYRTKFKDD